MIQPGDPAPDFTATTTNGGSISLHDYLGRNNVVLYFYPQDDTPGCTREACSFRDAKVEFDGTNTVILGVSADDQSAHQAFTAKYDLNFPLLVDSDLAIARAYGVPVNGGQPARVTFLIDSDGVVRRTWDNVRVDGHSADVSAEIAALGHS